jgi:hypothetical protein
MDRIENLLKTLLVLLFTIALFGCKDDKEDEPDNQSGKPYKVRLEISNGKPDMFNVYLRGCIYNIYENGTTNPVSVTEVADYLISYPSPIIKEFDMPRNFDGLGFSYGIAGDYAEAGMVYLKIYINDKLLMSYEESRSVIFFLYKSGNKYLVDINYKVAVFEFDKLD